MGGAEVPTACAGAVSIVIHLFDDPGSPVSLNDAVREEVLLWYTTSWERLPVLREGCWSPYPYKDDKAAIWMGGDTIIPGCACNACLSLGVHFKP